MIFWFLDQFQPISLCSVFPSPAESLRLSKGSLHHRFSVRIVFLVLTLRIEKVQRPYSPKAIVGISEIDTIEHTKENLP